MPVARMLPLGTVFKPKESNPGWEQLRYIVTGYFSCSLDFKTDWDYTVTPWPLGAIRVKGAAEQRFYGCNEESIGEIEFLGGVSEEGCAGIAEKIGEVAVRDDIRSPIASGEESIALSYGNLPCTLVDMTPSHDDLLPLGSIVSECLDPGQKVMIIQHSGRNTRTGDRHDYCICPWPQGANAGDENVYTLNHDEITAVHFRGYENDLSRKLARRLAKKRKRERSLLYRIFG